MKARIIAGKRASRKRMQTLKRIKAQQAKARLTWLIISK